MKKLLFFLFFIPITVLTQDSWVNVEVQTDQYAAETTWEIYNSLNEVVAFNPTYTSSAFQETLINLPVGDYNFVIYDEFGDGICCAYGEGWFGLSNSCGLDQYVYDFSGLTTTLFFTLEQCAQPPPGVVGCMDPVALNFNPEADQNSYTGQVAPTSCNSFYPSSYNYFGVDLDYYNANQEAFAIGVEISVGGFSYYIDGIGVPNNCNVGVAMVYVVYDQASADGDLMNTMIPGALYNDLYAEDVWTINPCEYIYGCNNPLAINYDALATTDDGSCDILTGCMDPTAVNYNPAAAVEFPLGISGPPPCEYFVLDNTSCGVDSVELIVSVVVDQYASETSWYVQLSTGEVVMEVLEGDLSGTTMGTLVSQSTCVADNTNLTFRIFDSYGDGLGGAQWGGIDGTWMIHTACDTLGSGGGNFGFGTMANGNTGDCDDLPIEGCTDDNYVEYNSEAVLDDLSCLTPNVYGCIDSNSINYDTEANTAEQFANCVHTLNLTDLSANGWGGSFLIAAQGEDYYGPFTVASGEALFTTELELNSSELVKVFFYSDPLSANFSNECGFEIISPSGDVVVFGGDNPILNPMRFSPYMYSGLGQCLETCIPMVHGCTDVEACNYDSDANTLSSCTYNIEYYDCSNQCNNDIDEDGICDENEVAGCQNPLQYNFDVTATDEGVCEPFVYGCTDNTMYNFNSEANTDNNSCILIVNGCTDITAYNYNVFANIDNNTCIAYAYGCVDITAFNYNVLANTDDGTCIPYLYGCTDITMWNYDELANTADDTCEPFVYGCMNPLAFNYNINANTDDDCTPFIYGCTDATSFNYDANANTDDNDCEEVILGCLNEEALNYNSEANTDNESCIEVIVDCTDPIAVNYNELANTPNNESCLYDAGCIGEPGDPYYLNDSCYAWIISIDAYCCEVGFDNACVELYDYCEQGWPMGVPQVFEELNVYPNPVNDILNIQTSLDVFTEVYSSLGHLVVSGTKSKRIDLSELPSGVYQVVINYNGRISTEKIIKL